MEFQTLLCPTENMEIEGEKKSMTLYWYIPAVEDILSKKFSIGPHSSWLFGQENKLAFLEVFFCYQWFWIGSFYNTLKYMGGNQETKWTLCCVFLQVLSFLECLPSFHLSESTYVCFFVLRLSSVFVFVFVCFVLF